MSGNEKDGTNLGYVKTTAGLPAELQGQLGKRLRELYSDLVKQPVPDKFLMLLEELKKSEPKEGKS